MKLTKKKKILIGCFMVILATVFTIWYYEYGPGMMFQRMKLVFTTIDTNIDGRLSLDEISKSSEMLLTLDENEDGYLINEELGGPEPIKSMFRVSTVFRVIDKNGDLEISPDEINQSNLSLLTLDTNKNGHLEKDEIYIPSEKEFQNKKGIENKRRNRLLSNMLSYKEYITGQIIPGLSKDEHKAYMLYHESNLLQDVQIGNKTVLIDSYGKTVHSWESRRHSPAGTHAKLLPNGMLLRSAGSVSNIHLTDYPEGSYDVLELLDWEGNIVWQYVLKKKHTIMHHDFTVLPNGNILLSVYESLTAKESTFMGWEHKKKWKGKILWFDSIYELQPNYENGKAEIVWEWRTWDHLMNKNKPEENHLRLNQNYVIPGKNKKNVGQLFQINAIDYEETLDQIVLSIGLHGEVIIIDHSTTIAESSTNKGGKHGKGGGILFRWGNPKAITSKSKKKRFLFDPFDVKWVKKDSNRMNLLIYNNGRYRNIKDKYKPKNSRSWGFGRSYSNILEIELPIKKDFTYDESNKTRTLWSWYEEEKEKFFSPAFGSVSRLSNGNTLFVSSHNKYIYEVTRKGRKVLDYKLNGMGQVSNVTKLESTYLGLKKLFD